MSGTPCQVLEWDSRFFGRKVARVEQTRLDERSCGEVLDWCRHEHVEWLYFLADADDAETVRVAEGAQFNFVDIRLELVADIASRGGHARGPARPVGYSIRDATARDVPALEAIAADVHRDSRFFFDGRVPREQAVALYHTWIRNSVQEGFADRVLVADVDGVACGYITGRLLPDGRGSIGLLGVGESVRGRGVGAALIHAALAAFAAQGLTQVSVVTQGRNVAAQRAYARQGFLSQSIRLWYHKWFQ